jgi:hypothetical protein
MSYSTDISQKVDPTLRERLRRTTSLSVNLKTPASDISGAGVIFLGVN